MSMNLFGGAAKFVDFQNSKGDTFIANSNGSKFGNLGGGNRFVGYFDIDPYIIPLTLEAMEAEAKIEFENKASGPVKYRINGEIEQTIASTTTGTITLANIGDKVEFYGDNDSYTTILNGNINYSRIHCYKDCYIYGNVMSLVDSDGFASADMLTGTYNFAYLFYNNTKIKNKTGYDLVLPATTLTENCYYSMFCGCSSLTTAPELPAETLATKCYCSMFSDCTSLASAPALPAITLAPSCYSNMFMSCTNLTSSPVLPATTLADYCYYYMFGGCTSLNNVTCLATKNISRGTKSWLVRVAAYGTFTKAVSATWETGSSDGIPSGWMVQDYQE